MNTYIGKQKHNYKNRKQVFAPGVRERDRDD